MRPRIRRIVLRPPIPQAMPSNLSPFPGSWAVACWPGCSARSLSFSPRDIGAPYLFAASYLTQTVVAFVAAILLLFLRIPVPPRVNLTADHGRPLPEIFRQPRLIVAVVCGVVSYSMMNMLMTSAPVAMVDCFHFHTDAMLGVQWHVVAMFAPSFFTGSLITRYGVNRIIGLGLAIMAAAAIVGWSGITLWHFWGALILLGFGWNFAFVGATALVTQCHKPNERNKVQAVNDFLVFGSMAIGSFSSGNLLAHFGWATVNEVALPLIGVAAMLLLWQAVWGRRPAVGAV